MDEERKQIMRSMADPRTDFNASMDAMRKATEKRLAILDRRRIELFFCIPLTNAELEAAGSAKKLLTRITELEDEVRVLKSNRKEGHG